MISLTKNTCKWRRCDSGAYYTFIGYKRVLGNNNNATIFFFWKKSATLGINLNRSRALIKDKSIKVRWRENLRSQKKSSCIPLSLSVVSIWIIAAWIHFLHRKHIFLASSPWTMNKNIVSPCVLRLSFHSHFTFSLCLSAAQFHSVITFYCICNAMCILHGFSPFFAYFFSIFFCLWTSSSFPCRGFNTTNMVECQHYFQNLCK